MTTPSASSDRHPDFHEYLAWDAPTRWFHWINALAVIELIATEIVILSDNALGISAAGKVLLKSIHVSFGYVMAINSALALRLGILWQPLSFRPVDPLAFACLPFNRKDRTLRAIGP